jgi:hypothetical protein
MWKVRTEIIIILIIFMSKNGNCNDSLSNKKIQLFNSGFLDVINTGQINSSSRFVKLYIGEQSKFSLPLSLYGGVSNNNIQSAPTNSLKSNDHLISSYLNPLSGTLNLAIEDVLFNRKKESGTKFGFSYQLGVRLLNAVKIDSSIKPVNYLPINFLNSYIASGLYFQTQAWEQGKANNIGVFWISLRCHLTKTSLNQLNLFLPQLKNNGLYTGYSFGFAVYITNSVDLKIIYYNYLKRPEIYYFNSIYSLSLNYTNNR